MNIVAADWVPKEWFDIPYMACGIVAKQEILFENVFKKQDYQLEVENILRTLKTTLDKKDKPTYIPPPPKPVYQRVQHYNPPSPKRIRWTKSPPAPKYKAPLPPVPLVLPTPVPPGPRPVVPPRPVMPVRPVFGLAPAAPLGPPPGLLPPIPPQNPALYTPPSSPKLPPIPPQNFALYSPPSSPKHSVSPPPIPMQTVSLVFSDVDDDDDIKTLAPKSLFWTGVMLSTDANIRKIAEDDNLSIDAKKKKIIKYNTSRNLVFEVTPELIAEMKLGMLNFSSQVIGRTDFNYHQVQMYCNQKYFDKPYRKQSGYKEDDFEAIKHVWLTDSKPKLERDYNIKLPELDWMTVDMINDCKMSEPLDIHNQTVFKIWCHLVMQPEETVKYLIKLDSSTLMKQILNEHGKIEELDIEFSDVDDSDFDDDEFDPPIQFINSMSHVKGDDFLTGRMEVLE